MSFEIIREIELAFIDIPTMDWNEAKEQIIANINKTQITKDRYLNRYRKDLKIEIENCIYHFLPQFFKKDEFNNYETIEGFTITKKEISKLISIITKIIIIKNDY